MKQNLIKRLTSLLAATTMAIVPICFSGCSDTKNLAANLSTDGKIDIDSCVFVVPENSTKDHYISFICHYDTGAYGYRYTTGYKNHKDYRITYKVSIEDYSTISKFDTCYTVNFNKKQISKLENLIETYEPIEIKELDVEENYLHKEFNEDFRFNEEEYLKNLE